MKAPPHIPKHAAQGWPGIGPSGITGALLIFLACLGAPLGAEPESLFQRGNEAYSIEDYPGAIDLYEQCLESAASPAVHFNLANAYYKAGDIGRAVLHFEKSLTLDPGNPEANANLAYVRKESDLAAPQYGPATRLGLRATFNFWCWTAAVGFWLGLAMVALPPLFGGGNLATRLVAILSLSAGLAAGIALYGYHVKSAEAVILNHDAALRVAPSEQSNEYGTLPAGELVRVAKTHQDYVFLNTTSDKSGWVRTGDLERVWAWEFRVNNYRSPDSREGQ